MVDMREAIFILFGVLGAIGVLLVAYPTCLYVKLKAYEKKVKNVHLQIKTQVDIKCDLVNSMDKKTMEITSLIDSYTNHKDEFEMDLKYYNEKFNDYILAYADKDTIIKCNIAEEKIGCTKDYYNETVCAYNRFKSSKVSTYLSKSFLIDDGKLF
jgi:hypothetical protein